MTSITPSTARPTEWHRPLLMVAAIWALLAVATTVAAFVAPGEVLGVNQWFKPIKFSISFAIYAVTFSWLIGQLHRLRRLAFVAGTISAIALLVETVPIVGFAAIGETSHFNETSTLHTIAWAVMGSSIGVFYLMILVVAIALFRNALGDPARTAAIRAGVVLGVVGMGLAFLMTVPTAAQLENFQGISGAHAVGIPDGGPGLPVLGWSTVAGDLRIPHFIGMHAVQLLPLFVLGLELIGRRFAPLARMEVRHYLVRVAGATYAAVVALVTWQALIGQSIVQPSGPVLVAGVLVALLSVTAFAAVLMSCIPSVEARARREPCAKKLALA